MIRYSLLFLFSAIYTYGFTQEELNEEGNWKLYPDAKDSSSVNLEKDSLPNDSLASYNGPAFVEIIQDYRIKQLLEKDKFIKDKPETPEIDGYRIKIYFGSGPSSQKEANEAKAKFLEAFPKTDADVDYATPNYVTLVGNYRTKMEAEKFLNQISDQFPEGFIVPSKIELPSLEQ